MKITCSIIQDLLPLYVDETLSDDSRRLVEEHLESCEECRKLLEELRQEPQYFSREDAKERKEGEKAAFQRIRRKLWKRRILSVVIAAILVFLGVRGADYAYYFWETYIPYEESGLEMRDGKLYATKTVTARLRTRISPDQKVAFYYMAETLYAKREYPSESCEELLWDFPATQEEPEDWNGETGIYGIEKVYYLSEGYWDYPFDYEDPEIGAKQTEEVESHSLLLWELDEEDSEKTEEEKGQEENKNTQDTAVSEGTEETAVGQGFRPPEGSHVDKNGNIVDPEGNTYNKKGEWQVPEGGSIDAQGRIRDKNGRIMGGGAAVGSVG